MEIIEIGDFMKMEILRKWRFYKNGDFTKMEILRKWRFLKMEIFLNRDVLRWRFCTMVIN